MQKAQLKKQDHRDTVSQGVVGSRGFLEEIQKALEAEKRGCCVSTLSRNLNFCLKVATGQ